MLSQGQKAPGQAWETVSLASLALPLASAGVGLASGLAGLSRKSASLAWIAPGEGWMAPALDSPALALAWGRPRQESWSTGHL